MKKWNLLLVLALLFVACKDKYDVNLDELYGTTSGSSSKVDKEIITCGDSKVMIINIGKASMTTVPYEWEWDSKTANDLSVTLKGRLLGMDECKVVNEGNDQLVLLTSSGGSALILSRKTKKCLFTAVDAPGAHSIELLPNNRVVVALSGDAGGFQVYDRNASNKVIFKEDQKGGHGVIWMENQQLLYALGYDKLLAYELKDWNTSTPSFVKKQEWNLPLGGTEQIPEPMKGRKFIKSFNYDKESGYLVYTYADIEWWTHNIHIQNPNKTITISNVNLYKVRTVPERE